MEDKKELLRKIPKIDEVLLDERLFFLLETTPRIVVVDCLREIIEKLRNDILSLAVETIPSMEILIENIIDKVQIKKKKSLRPVVNATGVILHTNLGRANLPKQVIESIVEIAAGYSTLEYNVKRGERGSRHHHLEQLIKKVSGAEAAMVVNNNAAATMLALSAIARGKEVVVSRGELVEIGGSFRIPDIMEESGAILKEVGTTNKTKLSDYEKAVKEGTTAALMKVHTSNYRIVGFTQEVEAAELLCLGKKLGLPVIYDMGSGLLVDLKEFGIDEPTVSEIMETGIDLILFSGDKLLGGPQAGIIAGKKEYIDLCKNHPLARAFRVDKMTLAAMEATFFEYLDIQGAKRSIPTLAMITVSPEALKDKAQRLCSMILERTTVFIATVSPCKDQVGGGAAPTVFLDAYAVVIQSKILSAEKMERLFRKGDIPIIVRIAHDQIHLNVRTIQESSFLLISEALASMEKTIEVQNAKPSSFLKERSKEFLPKTTFP